MTADITKDFAAAVQPQAQYADMAREFLSWMEKFRDAVQKTATHRKTMDQSIKISMTAWKEKDDNDDNGTKIEIDLPGLLSKHDPSRRVSMTILISSYGLNGERKYSVSVFRNDEATSQREPVYLIAGERPDLQSEPNRWVGPGQKSATDLIAMVLNFIQDVADRAMDMSHDLRHATRLANASLLDAPAPAPSAP